MKCKIGKNTRRPVPVTYKLGLAKMYIKWAEERRMHVMDWPKKTKMAYGAMIRFVRESSATTLSKADMQKEIMTLCRSLRLHKERRCVIPPKEHFANICR